MGFLKVLKEILDLTDIILINEKNLSLKDSPQIEGFIQKMRDQAHKLSKKNSMKRMSDSLKTSFLDDISGIGKIKKMRVINFFGSVQNLKKANIEMS